MPTPWSPPEEDDVKQSRPTSVPLSGIEHGKPASEVVRLNHECDRLRAQLADAQLKINELTQSQLLSEQHEQGFSADVDAVQACVDELSRANSTAVPPVFKARMLWDLDVAKQNMTLRREVARLSALLPPARSANSVIARPEAATDHVATLEAKLEMQAQLIHRLEEQLASFPKQPAQVDHPHAPVPTPATPVPLSVSSDPSLNVEHSSVVIEAPPAGFSLKRSSSSSSSGSVQLLPATVNESSPGIASWCMKCTCTDFEPNAWRPTLCKNCGHRNTFHTRELRMQVTDGSVLPSS